MTINLQLDSAGKLVISGGKPRLVDSTVQRVNTRLRMMRGEWFLDTTEGTPYLSEILVQGVQPALVRSAIQDRITSTEGVQDLVALDLSFDLVRRSLTGSARVRGAGDVFEVAI